MLAWGRSLEPDPRARAAFERPTARVAEALWLRERIGMTALIDVSDGLAGSMPNPVHLIPKPKEDLHFRAIAETWLIVLLLLNQIEFRILCECFMHITVRL